MVRKQGWQHMTTPPERSHRTGSTSPGRRKAKARRRPFFGVLMLLMLSYSLERWFLDGLPITSADAVSLVFIAIYAFAAIREDRLTQVSTALVATALLAGFTLGWTETLSQLATGSP